MSSPNSISAINIVNEDRHAAFVKHKPDFLVSMFWPQLEYFRALYEDYFELGLEALGLDKIAYTTAPIGNVEMDHILYFKRKAKKDIFAFIWALDNASWSGIFLSAFVVALFLSNYEGRKLGGFGKQCFLAMTAVVLYSSHYNLDRYKQTIVKYLIVLWLTATMLLQYLFGGDMAANLAMEPRPILIDSFDDLRNTNVTIYCLDTEMVKESGQAEKEYFNPIFDYYEDFTRRLTLLGFKLMATPGGVAEVNFGPENGTAEIDSLLMGPKSYVDYIQTHFRGGAYRDNTHVSRHGPNSVFYCFGRILTADSRETWAMDYTYVM